MGLKLNNRQLSALAEEILEKLKLDQKSELDALKAKYKKDKNVLEYDKLNKEYEKLDKLRDSVDKKIDAVREKIQESFNFKSYRIGEDQLEVKKSTSKEKIESAIILESIGADDVKSITDAVIKKFNK